MGHEDQTRRALQAIRRLRERVEELEAERAVPVAIVGVGCRLPGAVESPQDLWQLLLEEREARSEVPRERWDDALYDPAKDAVGKTYVTHASFVEHPAAFDAEFYGIPPGEAALLDPQHRLLLETTWTALEHAGIVPDALADTRAGVFVGIGPSDYELLQTQAGGGVRHSV